MNKKYLVVLNYHKFGYEVDEDYREFESDTIEECQRVVRQYIMDNEVASSEWYGGNLFDLKKKELIGMVAYNGRYFPKQVNVGKSTYIKMK